MFSKLQLEIIRGVSTVLFQEVVYGKKPGERAYKHVLTDDATEPWKGHYFEVDDTKYRLYTIDISGKECLGLDKFIYDDYGEVEDIKTLGYVILGTPDCDQWNLHRYCAAVERIIENGC